MAKKKEKVTLKNCYVGFNIHGPELNLQKHYDSIKQSNCMAFKTGQSIEKRKV